LSNFEVSATFKLLNQSIIKLRKMKKLIALFTLVFLGFVASAQTASVAGTPATMKEGVKQGVFKFDMPKSTLAEEIKRTSNFYVDYFTVAFNNESKQVTISMVDNSPEGRRVVTRFLLSNKVSVIAFDGKEYKITEFYDNYMRE
jgi:hypothetical protein